MALKLNPRYVAYATAHCMTAEEMLEFDKKKYPGGCMCGYILWIGSKLIEFRKLSPQSFMFGHLSDHPAFDKFLDIAINIPKPGNIS